MSKLTACFLVFLLLFTACSPAASSTPPAPASSAAPTPSVTAPVVTPKGGDLIIFTWADYVNEDVVAAFEEETGVQVYFSYFDSNEEMLTKLSAASGVGYDLVLASDYIIAESIGQKLAQELDYTMLPHAADIDPYYRGEYYDPQDLYTIPFAAGTPLIIYDPEKVDIPITGYASLWDPSLAEAVVVFNDARLMVGFTMMMLGGSLNSTDPALIAAAEEKLYELKPNILSYDYDAAYEKMIDGSASAGLMFSSSIVFAMDENPALEVVYPEEGMGYGIDCFFIPSGAANVDNAHLFLDFILQGEAAAELSMYAGYRACVSTAAEYLPEEILTNAALYIPDAILGDAEFMMPVDAATTELISDAWTRVRAR